jgi:uncharacterized membrane protein
MIVLLLGLVIFLGIHSTRIVAEPFRARMLQRLGEGRWKGMYSLVSALGLGLIVVGYGLARTQPVVLWAPPIWTRHLAALLTLGSFVLLAAAYVPRNALKARLHHPMMLGIKLWALAHLLANGTVADVLLFGAFLLWAVLAFRAARQRDRAGAVLYAPGTTGGTLTAVGVGIVAWLVFAFWLHGWLIGVQPFG